MNNKNSTGGGIGVAGVLTIVFIVLKCCKLINWPWVWVLSPLWISAVILIIMLLILFFISFLTK